MLEQFLFSLGVIGPVFLLVALGIILKYTGLINDQFVTDSSKLVFKIALPALLISKLSNADFSSVFDINIIYLGIGLTLLQFSLGFITSKLITKNPAYQGVIVQGSFRSNFAIIGLAILYNYFGNSVLEKATILLAVVMPLYNVLAVISLLQPHHSFGLKNLKKVLTELLTNPLIIAVFISIPFSYDIIEMPQLIEKSLDYVSQITLPLALIGIGATFNLKDLMAASSLSFAASALKIVLFPAICTSIAILFGFTGTDVGIIFVVFGSPTAIASFVMADAMKGDRKLAGEIIVVTTLFSIFTLSAGLTILKYLNLI